MDKSFANQPGDIGIWPIDQSQAAYDRTYRILVWYLNRWSNDIELIEDAVGYALSQSSIRIDRDNLRDHPQFISWLRLTARRRLVDKVNQGRREISGVEGVDTIARSLHNEIVAKCVSLLSPEDREIIELYRYTQWIDVIARISKHDRLIPDVLRLDDRAFPGNVRLTDQHLGNMLFPDSHLSSSAKLQQARSRRLRSLDLLRVQVLAGVSHPGSARSILSAFWACIQSLPDEERFVLELACFGKAFAVGDPAAAKLALLASLDTPTLCSANPDPDDPDDHVGTLALDVAIGLALYSKLGASPAALGQQARLTYADALDHLRQLLFDEGFDPDEWP